MQRLPKTSEIVRNHKILVVDDDRDILTVSTKASILFHPILSYLIYPLPELTGVPYAKH